MKKIITVLAMCFVLAFGIFGFAGCNAKVSIDEDNTTITADNSEVVNAAYDALIGNVYSIEVGEDFFVDLWFKSGDKLEVIDYDIEYAEELSYSKKTGDALKDSGFDLLIEVRDEDISWDFRIKDGVASLVEEESPNDVLEAKLTGFIPADFNNAKKSEYEALVGNFYSGYDNHEELRVFVKSFNNGSSAVKLYNSPTTIQDLTGKAVYGLTLWKSGVDLLFELDGGDDGLYLAVKNGKVIVGWDIDNGGEYYYFGSTQKYNFEYKTYNVIGTLNQTLTTFSDASAGEFSFTLQENNSGVGSEFNKYTGKTTINSHDYSSRVSYLGDIICFDMPEFQNSNIVGANELSFVKMPTSISNQIEELKNEQNLFIARTSLGSIYVLQMQQN